MALSNALHTKEITTAQVTAVSFGFFSEEEVRACKSHMAAMQPANYYASQYEFIPNYRDSNDHLYLVLIDASN
jgi:hypothetical protein